MKCPDCGRNHRYSDGMVCRCGYRFALDPKKDKIADGKFASFVRSASCNGTLFYTENQLYTAACRKSTYGLKEWIASIIVLAIGVAALAADTTIATVVLLVGGVAFLACLYNHFYYRLSRETFDNWLSKYRKQHGTPAKMLVRPNLHQPPKQSEEKDIFDYGVERVLIVQRDLMVDLLVKNQLHAWNKALVISSNHYPDYIVPHFQRILIESESLPVFLLHDATPEGEYWAKKLKKDTQINNGRRNIIDMGMQSDSLKRINKIKRLRLKRDNYHAPADVIPINLLANGISLSMIKETGMEELLLESATTDSLSNFG